MGCIIVISEESLKTILKILEEEAESYMALAKSVEKRNRIAAQGYSGMSDGITRALKLLRAEGGFSGEA